MFKLMPTYRNRSNVALLIHSQTILSTVQSGTTCTPEIKGYLRQLSDIQRQRPYVRNQITSLATLGQMPSTMPRAHRCFGDARFRRTVFVRKRFTASKRKAGAQGPGGEAEKWKTKGGREGV